MPPGAIPARVTVAYSGGMDSTVLLHALLRARCDAPGAWPWELRAVHVHHGLQAQADGWAAHCRATCAGWDVPLRVVRVHVERGSHLGPEGAARHARHAALAAGLERDDVVALAHHRDDQAETLLLRALRASGVDGLAGIRGWRRFGAGAMWRPLLAVPRTALKAYAQAHGLLWIEDPSNDDASLDRNHLRLHVLPLLRQRWPHADAALARSAALAAEAATLLADDDAAALTGCSGDDRAALSLAALRALPDARRARVLRRWIAGLDLPPLPARGVAGVEAALSGHLRDGIAFCWAGTTLRCWRGGLHVLQADATLPSGYVAAWDAREPPMLPTGDRLRLEMDTGTRQARHAPACIGAARSTREAQPDAGDAGLLHAAFGPLVVHARRGGERLRQPGRVVSQALKTLMHASAVPPWQRARIPLLSTVDGSRLLAAGDLFVDAALHAWLRGRCLRLAWERNDAPHAGNPAPVADRDAPAGAAPAGPKMGPRSAPG